MKKVVIFTDGACKGNPGPGGWAALLRYGKHEKLIKGADSLTTNNRMELMAAIQAFMALAQPCEVHLHTDSQYVQKGISTWLPKWKKNGWKTANKKSVKNSDLWQTLELESKRHKITWHWVKGHSGHVENDLVDRMANQAITELLNRQ